MTDKVETMHGDWEGRDPRGEPREDGGNPRIEFYKDGRGKHRWRFWRSSDKVGQSSQGYAERDGAWDNLCEVLGGQVRFDGGGTNKLYLERHVITEAGQFYERIPVEVTDA